MSHFRPVIAAHDVTEQQWRVIRALSEAGTLDASEVADKASILAPSLTRMIRSLEDRGLITKRKDKGDGRRTLLEITSAGQTLIGEVMPETIRVYEQIDAAYGAGKVEMLLDLLEQLAELRSSGQSTDLE